MVRDSIIPQINFCKRKQQNKKKYGKKENFLWQDRDNNENFKCNCTDTLFSTEDYLFYPLQRGEEKRNKLETKIFTFPKWFQRYITESCLGTKKRYREKYSKIYINYFFGKIFLRHFFVDCFCFSRIFTVEFI